MLTLTNSERQGGKAITINCPVFGIEPAPEGDAHYIPETEKLWQQFEKETSPISNMQQIYDRWHGKHLDKHLKNLDVNENFNIKKN